MDVESFPATESGYEDLLEWLAGHGELIGVGVVTRMSSHDETRAYVTRRRTEGLTTPEIMRCLKRYVARQTFKHLT